MSFCMRGPFSSSKSTFAERECNVAIWQPEEEARGRWRVAKSANPNSLELPVGISRISTATHRC